MVRVGIVCFVYMDVVNDNVLVTSGIVDGVVTVIQTSGTINMIDKLIVIDGSGVFGLIDMKYENKTSIPLM